MPEDEEKQVLYDGQHPGKQQAYRVNKKRKHT